MSSVADSITERLDKSVSQHVIEKGRGCPACDADDFRVEYHPLISYNTQIHRPVHCLCCNAEWDEIYQLVGGQYHIKPKEEE